MTGESFENSQPPTGRFMPSTRRQQSLASQTSANQLIEMCHAAASQTKEELKQYDEDLERHVSIDRKLKKVNRIKSPLNQTIPFAYNSKSKKKVKKSTTPSTRKKTKPTIASQIATKLNINDGKRARSSSTA